MNTINRAIYPGSFDPVTYGHLDVLERALNIFDEVVVLLASNRQKKTMFSKKDRIEMLKQSIKGNKRVKVDYLKKGLVVNYASEKKAVAIIRGLRQVSDFEYEYQISLMNRHLHPEITTVFLLPNEKYTYLASSIIKEVSKLGGKVSDFVPSFVEERLKKSYSSQAKLKI